MGTNYYYVENPCPHCGHGNRIHIGKSSGGWKFMFHAPDGIYSYKDWLAILESGNGKIVDSYGGEITAGEFETLVNVKSSAKNNPSIRNESMEWYDEYGHYFNSGEFS